MSPCPGCWTRTRPWDGGCGDPRLSPPPSLSDHSFTRLTANSHNQHSLTVYIHLGSLLTASRRASPGSCSLLTPPPKTINFCGWERAHLFMFQFKTDCSFNSDVNSFSSDWNRCIQRDFPFEFQITNRKNIYWNTTDYSSTNCINSALHYLTRNALNNWRTSLGRERTGVIHYVPWGDQVCIIDARAIFRLSLAVRQLI